MLADPDVWVETPEGIGRIIGWCPRAKKRVWAIVLLNKKPKKSQSSIKHFGLEELSDIKGP